MVPKAVKWVACRSDVQAFPDAVQRELGFSLYLAQIGQTPQKAKPLQAHCAAYSRSVKPIRAVPIG